MNETIEINGRVVGPGRATYVIAEVSANHNQDFEQADLHAKHHLAKER
jgi:pseudaminic acid synthase